MTPTTPQRLLAPGA
ncbi:hypothetical protein YPPY59_1283, partial [Yersinia pestis PY-59]